MKTITALALGLVSIAAPTTVAATPVDRIAFDYCYPGPDPEPACEIRIERPDGSGSLLVSYGVEPAWSPGGAKIAYRAFLFGQGIFIVDPADWSFITLTTVDGSSPAWSPDGTRIAYLAGEDLYVANVDGSGTVLLTSTARPFSSGQVEGRVGWSPDGGQLAYDCLMDASNADICAIGADGTGFVRLTDDPAMDIHPAFSPDGETIAFMTDRYGYGAIATMTSAGGGVTPVGFENGYWPAWTPDGSRLIYASDLGSLRIVNVNGSGSGLFRERGSHPAWTGWTQPLHPIASINYRWCHGLDCQFGGTESVDPDGTIVDYAWDFGDGTTESGATPGHTYAAAGTYAVTLVVTDDDGLTGTRVATVVIHPPVPPVAVLLVGCGQVVCYYNGTWSWDPDFGWIVAHAWNFGDGATASGATASHTYAASGTYTVTLTVTDDQGLTDTETTTVVIQSPPPPLPPVAVLAVNCAEVVCAFNGSQSWDPDGTIVAHAWNFGDGATASGATAMHTYAASGTYTVTLTVTDDDGLTDTETMALTVTTTQSHVGDLDGTSTQGQGTWTATVTASVHDTIEASLANAVLTAYWSVGGTSSSCTTNAAGQCTVARSFPNSTKTVTLSIGSVTHSTKTYVPSQNHDPDGDSTGTSILVRRH